MKKVIVTLPNQSYPIYIGGANLRFLAEEIKNKNLYKNIFVIIDSNVARYYPDLIKQELGKEFKSEFFILPSGERYKIQSQLNKIHSELIEKNFGRDTLLIAAGGGVTGDLAGFAASTYMRGIQLVHIPTTILAAVDSSVGGKTGINFNNRKNMIGTFYQPKFVLIDTSFFHTLPEVEKRSGLGEVIKYAFISDRSFYDFIKSNLSSFYSIKDHIIEKIIYTSVSIKAEVVKCDEKESGLRKILNFGHTFAHAIESDLKFRVKHGEAVIAGIAAALYLSNNHGILDNIKLKEFLDFLSAIKISKIITSFNPENLLNLMQSDKKIAGGKIKFVLLSDIGSLILDAEADKNAIMNALAKTKDFLLKKKG